LSTLLQLLTAGIENRNQLATLTLLHLKTARAYQMRLAFQEICNQLLGVARTVPRPLGIARRSARGSSR
jgi:hypothetical protein